MSKISDNTDMESEYDFSNAVHGKHYKAFRSSAHFVSLEPDVAEVFKDSKSVNRALRMLMDVADKEVTRNVSGKTV